jgi:hypothetical protein
MEVFPVWGGRSSVECTEASIISGGRRGEFQKSIKSRELARSTGYDGIKWTVRLFSIIAGVPFFAYSAGILLLLSRWTQISQAPIRKCLFFSVWKRVLTSRFFPNFDPLINLTLEMISQKLYFQFWLFLSRQTSCLEFEMGRASAIGVIKCYAGPPTCASE